MVFSTFSRPISEDKLVESYNNYTSLSLVIRRVSDAKEFKNLSSYSWWSDPGITKKIDGRLILISAISIPVGEYEIVARDVYLATYRITYTQQFPLSPPLRFTVRENQITYLGRHSFLHETGVNYFGNAVPSKIRVGMDDQFSVDYQMLLSVRPDWKNAQVMNGLTQ